MFAFSMLPFMELLKCPVAAKELGRAEILKRLGLEEEEVTVEEKHGQERWPPSLPPTLRDHPRPLFLSEMMVGVVQLAGTPLRRLTRAKFSLEVLLGANIDSL